MDNNRKYSHDIRLDNLLIGYRTSAHRKSVVFGPVNAEISDAEMIGIIGRNGIGKSTLLRTIAGLHPQLSGKVLIDGIENTKIPAKERARLMSFVSTESLGLQHIKVDELVGMGRFPYTGWFGKLAESDREMVQKSVDLTGISHLLKKSIHELSDGERQKVMIARALAQDTPIIILDEPTAFLDLPARYDILRILNDLTLLHGKTILFTTHDLTIAVDVADKLWLMAEGKLFEGAPEDLLIKKVFRKLFINSPVEFDSKTASFRFRREFKKEIAIHGEKKYRQLTKRAMERIGLRTIEEGTAAFELNINEQEDSPSWELLSNGIRIKFKSVYDLAAYIKNLH
ncbi:MAG: ABC transporter ATP-binding protein [Bacteroidales bacterium]|nr:ABC transporter ATP-binding protein [Bacteroidales bacterium]